MSLTSLVSLVSVVSMANLVSLTGLVSLRGAHEHHESQGGQARDARDARDAFRHNAIRDQVHLCAKDARWAPHKEKPGLLPSRPDDLTADRRRPADIFVPGMGALDFGVTCPHRPDIQYAAARNRGAAGRAYEELKRGYLDTATECASQGFDFLPVVFETSAARAPTATRVLKELARARATRRGADPSRITQGQHEALSVIIGRNNARMLLRRLGGPPMNDDAWRRERARVIFASELPVDPRRPVAAPRASPPPLSASPLASPPPRPAPLGAVGDAAPRAAGATSWNDA
eukprot:gene19479-biopygen42487